MKFSIDHDFHCHSVLSECCHDNNMTVQTIYEWAKKDGIEEQCITDHLWDSSVPGASNWYRPQNMNHVKQSLPQLATLPKDGPRMYFGCETEYCGNGKLGLSKEHFDDFDFVIIPPNHFHMVGFTRMETVDTEEKVTELFTQRLEEISQLDLPWHKVGIAHLNCTLTFRGGDYLGILARMDEDRLKAVFCRLACAGAGIEINTDCFFGQGWAERKDDHLRLFRMARDAGCLFYIGSDAHDLKILGVRKERAREVVDLLELTEEQRFHIANKQ